MQFKKNRAILSAVIAAAMASSALMSVSASAERTKAEKYDPNESYANRFLDMYQDVIVDGVENGYLSDKNAAGLGTPYHAVEELMCEAPDYGHETTSEAMSYIVWIAAMHDKIAGGSDLSKAWESLEMLVPDPDEQTGFFSKNELSSQVNNEWPEGPENYGPGKTDIATNGEAKNPLHSVFTSAYKSDYNGEYLMHWLADVDDWYGFSGSKRGEKGKFTFINTFQRGDRESCFETVPHPSIETLEWGNSKQGMKFAFQSETAKSWSYTNAPDAEDRAIQAVYAANRWGVGDASVSKKAAMMGDECRNNMFDKYYKAIGSTGLTTAQKGGLGEEGGQHYLMSWYTGWGGAADGTWAWQIGCSHSHQFYQNPLAAYGLLYDKDLSAGMKAKGAAEDYKESLKRQVEMYLWLQSKEGPFAGGCTNSWGGQYKEIPSNVSKFYKMGYVEHPVYLDPGSNHWTGNQFWATQRLAELYYIVCTDGDASDVKPGGMSLKEALKTVLDKWVDFFVTSTTFEGDDYSVVSSLDWTGQPDSDWNGTYKENTGLSCTIAGRGNTDLGCANSLANTLIYYAKAEGVDAAAATTEGSTTPEKALYTAKQLLDRTWALGRDNIGMTRPDANKSLARIFEQEVYIPEGNSGTYPYGYEVSHGATFFDIRPMYEDLKYFKELKDAYDADKKAGAKLVEKDDGTTLSDDFENVGKVQLEYHRFWHAGDIMMANGTMALLYPDVTPDGTQPQGDADWGNVNCSTESTGTEEAALRARIDVKDAVLLARYIGNDNGVEADITDQGIANANVKYDDGVNADDLSLLLQWLANLVPYTDLGNQ